MKNDLKLDRFLCDKIQEMYAGWAMGAQKGETRT